MPLKYYWELLQCKLCQLYKPLFPLLDKGFGQWYNTNDPIEGVSIFAASERNQAGGPEPEGLP